MGCPHRIQYKESGETTGAPHREQTLVDASVVSAVDVPTSMVGVSWAGETGTELMEVAGTTTSEGIGEEAGAGAEPGSA